MEPFFADVAQIAEGNHDFRNVRYTGPHTQVVAMRLNPGEEIGRERHDVDQVFLIVAGLARVFIDDAVRDLEQGSLAVVPAGAWHNVANLGQNDLRLVTLYSPPEHPDGTVHHTRLDAIRAELMPA